jgi:hypothetical protein
VPVDDVSTVCELVVGDSAIIVDDIEPDVDVLFSDDDVTVPDGVE